jgi:hypothetical protein
MPDGSTLIRINNWTWGQLDVLKFRAALVSGGFQQIMKQEFTKAKRAPAYNRSTGYAVHLAFQ